MADVTLDKAMSANQPLLAQTLAAAQAARRTSELWMRATQLAAEQMERVRTDECGGAIESLGLHTRSCITEPIVDYPALQRVTVIVEWEDREPHRFQLSSLLPVLP